jgi:CO dehydrogenase maturation factor
MKLAISGKGGVGKTTLAAALALLFRRDGSRVIAVDADPDSNLAATLGFPNPGGIVPLSEMKDLIAERTGAGQGGYGGYFKLNPKVDDIPDAYAPEHRGIKLLVMGGARKGGGGCVCPESAFLRALLAHVLFNREDVVLLDMEAGVEHLSRGTARGVDALIAVVEPGRRSFETATRIKALAGDLGIRRVFAVGNRVRDHADEEFIQAGISGLDLLGFVPYCREAETGVSNDVAETAAGIKANLAARLKSD